MLNGSAHVRSFHRYTTLIHHFTVKRVINYTKKITKKNPASWKLNNWYFILMDLMFSTNWRVRVNKMILLSSISPNATKWEIWIHRLKISPSSQVLAFFRSMIISYHKNKLYSQPHPTLTQESEFVDWASLSCAKPRFGSVSWSQRLVLPSVREQLESVV